MKKNLRVIALTLTILLLTVLSYFVYLQGLYGVHPTTITYYTALRSELVAENYQPNYFVLSTTRPKWFNQILVKFGGAASQSQHLHSTAIDIIVLDINQDGAMNEQDVDIVYSILHQKIVQDKGGIGTYKHQSLFFDRQMVHFDSRGHKARWSR